MLLLGVYLQSPTPLYTSCISTNSSMTYVYDGSKNNVGIYCHDPQNYVPYNGDVEEAEEQDGMRYSVSALWIGQNGAQLHGCCFWASVVTYDLI